MSAFPVSDEHLAVIVHSAMNRMGCGTRGISWYHNGTSHRLGIFDYDQADRVLAMLQGENRKSLQSRYEDADTMWPLPIKPPKYPRTLAFSFEPTAVEVLKAISCYEYQSCEHEAWEASEAAAFCQSLRLELLAGLPGYDAAPWEWTAEEFTKRRGGAISLSALLVERGL